MKLTIFADLGIWIGLSCNDRGNTPLSLAGGPAGSFGRYDLAAAWRIEHILTIASRLGINVLLCFEAQQSFQMLFNSSVYWKGNGGPLEDPKEWWTNDAIKAELQQRLQYAVRGTHDCTITYAAALTHTHAY